MAVTLSASLLGSVQPRPVQLTLAGLTSGDVWSIVRNDPDGQRAVSGCSGVSNGSQVVRIDNRTPLNVPLTYTVTVNGATTVTSAAVTVAYAANRQLLQSLDGQKSATFEWVPNGLPITLQPQVAVLAVPGRTRPPVFSAAWGDGGGELAIRTAPGGAALLRAALNSGLPVVVRTDGALLDWPAVELLQPTAVASRATYDVRGMPDRDWVIGYTLADDPEPSRVLVAYNWDYIDALARTWDQMDALALTWDQVDAFDWSTLA